MMPVLTAFISEVVVSSSQEAFWNASGANVSGEARCVRGEVSDIHSITLVHLQPTMILTVVVGSSS